MAYVAYLPQPDLHTNAAPSHAGWGRTREEAEAESTYWANQRPWVRIVPASRAPLWALEEAREAYHAPCHACGRIHPPDHRRTVCVDPSGFALPMTRTWPMQVMTYEF